MEGKRQVMTVVFVGHVDHGKSSVIGRLLHDAGALPDGKLERIKRKCERESKVFEYAFLLDALIDEQDQGITIDSARCFFKTKKRDYLIIDAPGHIEFLKNMVSGAARAEAAFLIIDAKEGVRENSKRHGYILSMLGLRQVIVIVNKMDLVGYDSGVFNRIKEEFGKFLGEVGIKPMEFIPVSAIEGENIAKESGRMGWFKGNTVLSAIDSFKKETLPEDKPLRLPVQDVYKFTEKGDERRIMAGRVESGTIHKGDKVVFMPSGKKSAIKTVEDFTKPGITEVKAGYSTALTLTEQVYVGRGEIMCGQGEKPPHVSSQLKASIFWMGREPMETDKEYKLKIGTSKVEAKLREIMNVLDASTLETVRKGKIERHEVAECMMECQSPIAFDLFNDIQNTGRFVIVDGYDVAGGGIITNAITDGRQDVKEQVRLREKKWYPSEITSRERALSYGQTPALILITGRAEADKKTLAKELEKRLFHAGRKVYYLGIGNLLRGVDADVSSDDRAEHVRRLGEVSHILTDAGLIAIATASDLTRKDMELLQTIVLRDALVIAYVGERQREDAMIDLYLSPEDKPDANAAKITELLEFKKITPKE